MSKHNSAKKASFKWHIKKGDLVKVVSGEDKGKEGRVISTIRKTQRALVEGVNMISVHTKPNAQYPNGGIIKKEAAVHISNLMIVDPKSGEPTRIGRKIGSDNEIIRYSKKSGEVIK